MVDSSNGVLKKGREIRITGCRLRTAVVSGSSQIRLLPTEYLVVLLDEVSLNLVVLLDEVSLIINLFSRQFIAVDAAVNTHLM
jgi:hypothetical protein